MHVHICIFTLIHTCMHTIHAHSCMHILSCTHTHGYMLMHTRIHMCMYTHAYTHSCTPMHTCSCIHACTHAHAHRHIYTLMHTFTHAHAHMHIYTLMHTCTHAHECTHTHQPLPSFYVPSGWGFLVTCQFKHRICHSMRVEESRSQENKNQQSTTKRHGHIPCFLSLGFLICQDKGSWVLLRINVE